MAANAPLYRRTALIAGIAVLVLSLLLASESPRQVTLPEGFATPILALEFARTPDVLQQLLPDDATREAFMAVVRLDGAYIVAYAAFLTAVTLSLIPAPRYRVRPLALIAIAATADVAENHQLMHLLTVGSDGLDAPRLHLAVIAKFGALALLAVTLIAWVPRQQRAGRMAIVGAVGAAFFTAGAFLSPAWASEGMLLSLAIHWASLFTLMLQRTAR